MTDRKKESSGGNVTVEDRRLVGLSQNQLKGIAAAAMVVDHLGVQIFPQYIAFRIIGRLAFPIFAYFIYEGMKYTHRPAAYLGRMLSLGMLCVVGYGIFSHQFYGNILITFSLSICLLWACQNWMKKMNGPGSAGALILTVAAMAGIAVLCSLLTIDYGFWGVLLPLFPMIGEWIAPKEKSRLFSLGGFALGLALLCLELGGVQWFSLAALLLLSVYTGKRGKWEMQHFFYWFYPVHLILIYLISELI